MTQTRVVIVDDHPVFRQGLRDVLETDPGLQVVGEAANGEVAFQMAEDVQPEVMLIDINLPDIDGYEVARRLRASSKSELATVPIIAVTANALKGDAEKALEAGCDVYMSKPINIRELWARVEAFVPSP